MNFTQHALRFTLRNRFDNNYSRYARAIGVDPHNLRRAMISADEGGDSGKMLGLTMGLYAGDRAALFTLLTEYTPDPGMLKPCQCVNVPLVNGTRTKYQECAAQNIRFKDLCEYSDGVIDRMEAACCGVNYDQYVACIAYRQQGSDEEAPMPDDCPCVMFDAFTDSLLKYAAGCNGR